MRSIPIVVSGKKFTAAIVFAAAIILALGLSLGMLADKEIFKERYKDIGREIGREEAIKEFSDLIGKIPGGEKSSTDIPMLIPSPEKGIIKDIEQGEMGAKI